MKYEYFIAYSGQNDGVPVVGRCTITRDRKIKSFKDIELIELAISGNLCNKIVITNWKRFE